MPLESEASSKPETAQNGTSEPAATTGQGKPNVAVGSRTPPSQPSITRQEIICKKEKTGFDTFKDYMEVFGIVVLVVYTIYTVRMYYANKKAADAAQDAASTARESLNSVQRAFVNFKEIKSQSFFQKTPFGQARILGFSTAWENSGTTPATKVIQQIQIDSLPSEPDDQRFKGKEGDYEIVVIAPKETKDSGIINEPELLFFGDQTKTPVGKTVPLPHNRRIFFWGWVLYRDVFFPQTKTHLTEYCEELASANYTAPKPGFSSGFTFNFGSCHQHNCTDEDCKDYQNIVTSAPQ